MTGGGGNTTTQKSTTEPWSEQKPYILQGFQEAQNQYETPGPNFFPGSTVAPPSPGTQSYWDMVMGRGTSPDKGVTQAQDVNSDFLSGKYLNANPYDDQVYRNIASHVIPSVASSAMTAGRQGSQLSQNQAVGELTKEYAPYASANYNQGLTNMQHAEEMAPALDQASYYNANQVGQVGQQQHQQGQAEINDAIQRYNFYQQQPYDKLMNYMKFIQGDYGGTSATSTPTPSVWQSLLGAGLSLL